MTALSFDLTRREALAGLGGVSLLALGGCATIPRAPVGDTAALLDDIAYNLLKHEPERATGLGVDTGAYAALRGKLEDQSPAGQRAFAETLRRDLARVRGVERAGLDADTVTSLEVVESAYATALEGFALPYGDVAVGSWRNAPYVVIQNVGTYLDAPRFFDSTQPLKEPADGDFYLARLDALPAALDGELARMRAARGMGVVPPVFLLDKAIAAMERTIAEAREGGALVAPLTRVAKDIGASFAPRGRAIVTGPVVAALERQLAELQAQRALGKTAPGMWAQPRGDEWYAWALRATTTTRMTPDEIHQQGLDELAMLHARMDPILKRIGYTKGSVGARMQALSDDPRYKFAEGDPGRAEIMAFLEERVAWIKAQMPRAFSNPVNPNMEIRRLPPAEEIGAPGAYGGAGSKDGTIPGRMWINLRSTDLHRKYDLADLAYHETIPGHVWEGEYSNRLPLIRSILAFGAFSEGWALYAQQLADELGAYKGFEVGQLGYLQSLAFRACRLVVDTGLHHKRWSREQGRAFFVERNGSKPEEVAGEVDRYCSWPGQATGYKIGHSEIVRQRRRAETALGARYDFKGFNDAVILGGNAPLDVMARNVDRFITARAV
ncbi:DUF885 domain-containing protein [Qipengyuania sediminis]|uniref:DUF885 domain-containing protein n=1 Tax=Qipengyuania sediminis TaxID=1532023 RepID=UPI00105995BF|nr:DUF885 family protein [Qipengyuania sediminis]